MPDLPLFLLAGLGGAVSFFSPCVLPLVPAYLSYASGQTLGELRADADRLALMRQLSAFVLGFGVVFVLLGASASFLFPYLLQWRSELNWVAGGIVMLFGAQLAGIINVGFLTRSWQFAPAARQSGGLLGAFALGLSFAVGWTPCIGPILASLLVLAGQRDSLAVGMTALACYAAGLGIPFLVSGWASANWLARRRSPHLLVWMPRVGGGILLVSGALIVTNQLQRIGFQLLNWFPALGQLG